MVGKMKCYQLTKKNPQHNTIQYSQTLKMLQINYFKCKLVKQKDELYTDN